MPSADAASRRVVGSFEVSAVNSDSVAFGLASRPSSRSANEGGASLAPSADFGDVPRPQPLENAMSTDTQNGSCSLIDRPYRTANDGIARLDCVCQGGRVNRSESGNTNPSSVFLIALLASAALAIAGCKGKDANNKKAADSTDPTKTTDRTTGKTTQPSDTGTPVVVPKKDKPPPLKELPAQTGDDTGSHKWSIRLGGTKRDSARSVAVDKDGNMFVGGLMTGTVTVPGSPTMTAESNDALLIKLTSDGRPVWARNFGGPGPDMIESVAVDGDGNVIVGGGFGEELVIGDHSLAASGSDDGFVAKFDTNGKRLWAKRLGGMAEDNVQGVAVDAAGNVLVSATFRGNVSLGTERFLTEGIDDAYLISLAPDSSFRWIRKLAGPGVDYARSVTTDASGAIFWTAEFSQTAKVGSTPLQSAGNRDVALIKLSADGTPVWATRFGSLADDNVFDVALDAGGDILLTGTFKETMTLGSIELKSAGEADAYVAKLAHDGVPRWAKSYGTKTEDVGAAITADRFGNVYAGGWFRSSVDFGGGPLKSNGEKDIFLIKLSRDGEHRWSKNYGGKQVDYVRSLAMAKDDEPVAVGTFFLTANFGGDDLVADSSGQTLPTGEIYAAKFGR